MKLVLFYMNTVRIVLLQRCHFLVFKCVQAFILMLLSFQFFSCQTEIEVIVPSYYNKLVVEGYIENGEYPVVSLYRSAPYFSTMSLQYLLDSIIVTNAKVFITSSKGETHELFINNILTPNPAFPLFFAYSTKAVVGELNTSYTLKIEWNDKIYTSETTILNTFNLDSIFFAPDFGHEKIDSTANLRIKMTDDGSPYNYYQFKVKIHCKKSITEGFQDRLWITTIPAAFDNSPFRGLTFNYEIIRGSASTVFMPEMSEQEMRRYLRMNYRVGDTVFMKYGKLDYDAYIFWSTANGEITFGQNPFMSPTPIVSNIVCNTGEKCLGVWNGLAKQEIMMVLDTTTTKSAAAALRYR